MDEITATNARVDKLNQVRHALTRFAIAFAQLHLLFVFAWAILHALFGDRWAWLFLLNTFAQYLFFPLPITLAIAITTRRHLLWIGTVGAFLIFAFMYGGLFIPKIAPQTDQVPLTVMTYNMLGFREHPESVVATIRAVNADVIAIQELNPLAADAIRRDLIGEFPYQFLDPQEGVAGAGIISRYPLQADGATMPGSWIGTPQILTLDLHGKPITLLHVHTFPTTLGPLIYAPGAAEQSIRERELQAHAVAKFATARKNEPLIVTGDFNMVDQNAGYAIVTSTLVDAWRAAGWGWGQTFPSTNMNGNPLPTIAHTTFFTWLIRIDYIFHSRHWQTVSADVGPWDGYSDHRPVVVKVVLTDN